MEAHKYSKEELRQLSPHQKYQVQHMKIAVGWINGRTSPRGLMLNSDGYAVPSPSVVSAVLASFFQPPSTVHIPTPVSPLHVGMVQLPPPPNDTPLVPPAVNSTNAGMVFCQSGSNRNINVSTDDTINPGNYYGTISMVNGRPINGYIYYSNEDFISQLLRQLFVPILHL